ncbi:type IV secretory system conjugative DNA transfer family protein [Lactobacillus taiwanensis]|uniref:type IV secretory system conjugative DNA transfer family protein n=1 Tax=Lactobacillus taiwanensis TaxID=508451 RepID=UPI003D2FFDFE
MDFLRRFIDNLSTRDSGKYVGHKVSGEMKYEVYDETDRDVYRNVDAKKTVRKFAPSKEWIYYATSAIFSSIYSLAVGLVTATLIFIYRFNHSNASQISFSDTFWATAYIPGTFPAVQLGTLVISLIITLIFYIRMDRNYRLQNIEKDTSELNKHEGDGRLLQPEELTMKFDIFPDTGAHSSVDVSAVISHMIITNDGLKKVEVADKTEDGNYQFILKKEGITKIVDEQNKIELDDGTIVWNPYDLDPYDEEVSEELLTKKVPMIDTKLGQESLKTVSVKERYRVPYNPKKLLYNPDKRFEKTLEYTVAEKINNDWWIPDYELQRPGGFYLVASGTLNSILVAMTRAGKGQTIIEPTIDMWTRMDDKPNILANDPKGELLVKFHYPARKRGMEVIVLNLLDRPRYTDIYNPLGFPVNSARQGRFEECADLVKALADTLFPADTSENPVWTRGPAASFRSATLGLIDYFLEEEYKIRDEAAQNPNKWPTEILDAKLDDLWSVVTPTNVYQMMSQLSSKKTDKQEYVHLVDGDKTKESIDYLTLFFDASSLLPKSKLRMQMLDQYQTIRAMSGSSRTLSSVYAIALTTLVLFTDPLIMKLTSGKPSQNLDIVGLGFPRRFGVKLEKNFAHRFALEEESYVWTVYEDKKFLNRIDEDDLENSFSYNGMIDDLGWIYYRTKAIFPEDIAYIKLEIFSRRTKEVLKSFYFEFEKRKMVDPSGNNFVVDSVTEEEIIKDGYLRELIKDESTGEYIYGRTQTKSEYKTLDGRGVRNYVVNALEKIEVHYSEKAKFIDFVTPPNKAEYAKILLMGIDQIFNFQVGEAYLATEDQKPFLGSKGAFDEAGQLVSEGKGIPFLERKMSIGLAQRQQYMLVVQDFSQLPAIYSDNITETIEANSLVINYLKSNNSDTISHLSKMSGTMHKTQVNSQSIIRKADKLINSNEATVNKTISVEEVPVITENDMRFIPPSNNMVFGNGLPVWSKNQLALPVSRQLYANGLGNMESSYVNGTKLQEKLEDIELNGAAGTLDVFKNQPDFYEMTRKRVNQAMYVKSTIERYKSVYGKTDADIANDDMEETSKFIMRHIKEFMTLHPEQYITDENISDNTEQLEANDNAIAKKEAEDALRYAEGTISRADLKNVGRYNATKNVEKVLRLTLQKLFEKALNEYGMDSEGFVKIFKAIDNNETANVNGLQNYSLLIAEDSYPALSVSFKDGDELDRCCLYKDDSGKVIPELSSVLRSFETWTNIISNDQMIGFDFDKICGEIAKEAFSTSNDDKLVFESAGSEDDSDMQDYFGTPSEDDF